MKKGVEKRKAQASILTIVLIIAISIVGILIVFNVVRPLVSEKKGEIETGFKGYLAALQGDSDGDGYTDDQEEAAGTDPNDPNDFPLAPVVCAEYVYGCRDLNESKVYCLNEDLVIDYNDYMGITSDCFHPTADNLIFDLQGYSITASNTTEGFAAVSIWGQAEHITSFIS